MTAPDQAVARGEFTRQLLEIERDEEAFLLMAIATSYFLDRRADADRAPC